MTASVALHPTGTQQLPLWISISALAAAFVALAAWFVVAISTSSTSITPRPVTNVQQGGGADQNNQLCAPAPGTRYC